MLHLNDEKMFYDVAEGMGVVIDFSTGVYFAFNKPGTEVLDRLIKGEDPRVILERMRQAKNCPSDIESKMNDFVAKILDKEILLECEGDFVESGDFPEEAFAEGKVPVVDEFADVQDLIMADPIHDVDPNMGWPVMK